MTPAQTCRACGEVLCTTFVDLGTMPLANAYLTAEQLELPEARYPLHARVCARCFLVQVNAAVPPAEIFSDYPYFSSVSETWVAHARRFAEDARRMLRLDSKSMVVEVASNDGYLLQHFASDGSQVLGIEPAANVAEAARDRGVPTEVAFFGSETALRLGVQADLLVANNVLAHVPDVNDFVAAMRTVLKPEGVLSVEIPHLLRLIEGVQFDTIYHEHFSYFSLLTVQQIFADHGIELFDVESLPTHGGSLRVWGARSECGRGPSDRLLATLHNEKEAGLQQLKTYEQFPERVDHRRQQVINFLEAAHAAGDSVAGYGAAAKGNTLLNFCDITEELLPFVSDRSPHKQGLYLPGSHLPVLGPEAIDVLRPQKILILAWNLADEIMAQLARAASWGGAFVTTMPEVKALS